MKLSWDCVDLFIDEVVSKVNSEWKKDYVGVYGPPRGGLPLAVMLSHRLDIPLLESPYPGCLIVDDIADTGETLKKYADSVTVDIVTMGYHEDCCFVPKYWMFEKDGDDWMVFPWEKQED